jgi:hypothetical protein
LQLAIAPERRSMASRRAKFLPKNLPQHFGRNRTVILRRRRTQYLIHQCLIPTTRSLGLRAIAFYYVTVDHDRNARLPS